MDDEERMEQWRENWKHVDRDGLLRVMLRDEDRIKELEGLLRINNLCTTCGDSVYDGKCKNIDCGKFWE